MAVVYKVLECRNLGQMAKGEYTILLQGTSGNNVAL